MRKTMIYFTETFLVSILLVYCNVTVAQAASFYDVTDSDWHLEAIEYVTANNLMEGDGEGNFHPNQLLTRAEAVMLLYRLAGSPTAEPIAQFQDVARDAWYADSVFWAYQQNIVRGTSREMFSPSTSVTREQLAVFINNYIETQEIEIQMTENAMYRVKDCWLISRYAERGVFIVCETGLMNPDSQFNFNPQNGVTRADAAVVFMRLTKALAGEQLTGILVPDTEVDFSKLSLSQKEKDAQALAVAKQIVSVIPTDRSDIERVKMAAHIVSHYSKFCTYTMSGPDYSSAYGVFVKGEYSCAGSTRALGLVLNCMGYQWRHVNENQYSHQWCELDINGQVIIADGQTGQVGYRTGDSVEYVSHPFVSLVDPWPYTLQ